MTEQVDTQAAAECADAIHKLMDGTEWSADTLDAIAAELRAAGYVIRDPADMPEEE